MGVLSEYTHSNQSLIEGCASSRFPIQARDLKRRYRSMSSLAGAFLSEWTNKVSDTREGSRVEESELGA